MLLPYWMIAFFNATMLRDVSNKVGIQLSPQIEIKANPMYDGCGSTKLCLGYPSGCVKKMNCKAFSASYQKGS